MSIEDKFDGVKKLLKLGKKKGFLLYDEVNDALPNNLRSSEDLDNIFLLFGEAGIEVIDSEQYFERVQRRSLPKKGEEEERAVETVSETLDKTNDPVRMYLREMGTVPLLTREGEVEIAKRIERGKFAVVKSISRTPTVAKTIIRMGEQRSNGALHLIRVHLVRKEPLPGLSPQTPGEHHPLQERRRRVRWVAKLLEHDVRNVVRRIQTDEVRKLERSHRVSAAERHALVDVLERSEPVLVRAHRIQQVGNEQAVRDETRAIGSRNRLFAEGLSKAERLPVCLVARRESTDHFD